VGHAPDLAEAAMMLAQARADPERAEVERVREELMRVQIDYDKRPLEFLVADAD
jgi:hypothetical protein